MASASDSSPEGCLFDSGQPHDCISADLLPICFVCRWRHPGYHPSRSPARCGGVMSAGHKGAFVPFIQSRTKASSRPRRQPCWLVSCVVAFGLRLHVASGFCASISVVLVTLNKRPLYEAQCETVLLATTSCLQPCPGGFAHPVRPTCIRHLFGSQQPSSSSLDGLDHFHPKPKQRPCGRLDRTSCASATNFQPKRHKPCSKRSPLNQHPVSSPSSSSPFQPPRFAPLPHRCCPP